MKKASLFLILGILLGFSLNARQAPKTTRVVGKLLDNTSFKEISLWATTFS
jgi:hypothetical protein